ncbi:MAG: GldG family protein, partial [bacterium]|nr:GldG family protein [bacterium]
MKRSYSLPVTIIILAAFLVLVNLVSAMVFRHARVDLTSEKLYTLSPGTKNILEKLEDRLRFKFYLTGDQMKDLPSIQLYSTRVKEMIEEYVKLSGGKVSLAMLDPKPDTEEEEVAQKYGLQKVPLQGGRSLYMGLVISDESGNDEVIPFFNPEREEFLEYDISKAVVNVSNPEKKVVGILSPLPVMGDNMPTQLRAAYGGGSEPWAVVSQLRQLYRVKEIDIDAQAIDEDVDILMLVHPKGLSPATRMAIDQYLLKGGRIVAFIDPNCEADMPPPDPENPYAGLTYDRTSGAEDLLASWGLSMKKDELAADLNLAANVRSQSYRVVPYPVYLNMDGESVNSGEVITAGIESLLFASAGALTATQAGGDLEIVPLLQTTEEA